MDAVEQQRKQLLEEIQTLPEDVLQEVSNLIAHLRQKTESVETSAEIAGTEHASERAIANPYQELKEFGLIGFAKDGPSDLSVNYKKYLAEDWLKEYDNR